MTAEEELEMLIEEQRRDDTDVIWPERHVSFSLDATIPGTDGISFHEAIGVDIDGEIVFGMAGRVRHGAVLAGAVLPHGTTGGYTNWKCRCGLCRAAHSADWKRRYHERMKHDPRFKKQRAAQRRRDYHRKHPDALTLSERASRAATARHNKVAA